MPVSRSRRIDANYRNYGCDYEEFCRKARQVPCDRPDILDRCPAWRRFDGREPGWHSHTALRQQSHSAIKTILAGRHCCCSNRLLLKQDQGFGNGFVAVKALGTRRLTSPKQESGQPFLVRYPFFAPAFIRSFGHVLWPAASAWLPT